jgi:hypothetical protein
LKLAGAHTIREHFLLRFGGAQSQQIKDREKAYTAGMPNVPGGDAFEKHADMESKLNQLEAERTFFWNACPESLRETYEFCSEQKLCSVVLEHVPLEYAQNRGECEERPSHDQSCCWRGWDWS